MKNKIKIKDMTPEQRKKYYRDYQKKYKANMTPEDKTLKKQRDLEYQAVHRAEITAKYYEYHKKRREENPEYYKNKVKLFKEKKKKDGKTKKN